MTFTELSVEKVTLSHQYQAYHVSKHIILSVCRQSIVTLAISDRINFICFLVAEEIVVRHDLPQLYK